MKCAVQGNRALLAETNATPKSQAMQARRNKALGKSTAGLDQKIAPARIESPGLCPRILSSAVPRSIARKVRLLRPTQRN
ncbi:MAG TPA: hypothetical protein VFJ47_10665, partial [Terriglobales bacterium]|nr:hypothetical protein [Terriglobales bacterium]